MFSSAVVSSVSRSPNGKFRADHPAVLWASEFVLSSAAYHPCPAPTYAILRNWLQGGCELRTGDSLKRQVATSCKDCCQLYSQIAPSQITVSSLPRRVKHLSSTRIVSFLPRLEKRSSFYYNATSLSNPTPASNMCTMCMAIKLQLAWLGSMFTAIGCINRSPSTVDARKVFLTSSQELWQPR